MARKTTRKTAKTINPTPTASEELAPENKAVTFLDLPGELRNQVYGYVLPDRGYFYPGGSLRKDEKKSSTNFMATCRQIHNEGASLLYGPKEFSVSISRDGRISFPGQRINFSEIARANFAALNQIKVLNLYVAADDSINVPNVQDALFAFFGQLRSDHKLHTLQVHIDVSMSADNSQGYEIFTSNYAERMFKQNIMREFRDIQPGQISRAHLAAFLTDPIRTIRNLRDGKKKGKFTLDFTGKTGRPWRDLQPEIRALVQGNSPVPDYKVFCRYFKVLRSLSRAADSLDSVFSKRTKLGQKFAAPRIRGDIEALSRSHDFLIYAVDKLIAEKVDFSTCSSRQDAENREHRIREVVYLIKELEAAKPAQSSDTTFLRI